MTEVLFLRLLWTASSTMPMRFWLMARSPWGNAMAWEAWEQFLERLVIEVTITRQMLDTDLQSWFLNVKNAERAKQEILALFSEEPGDGYTWSEQDIWEQSRKIIDRWNRIWFYGTEGQRPLCSQWTSRPREWRWISVNVELFFRASGAQWLKFTSTFVNLLGNCSDS